MITNILLVVFCATSLLFFILYTRLKNRVLGIIKSLNKPIRKGYYTLNCTQKTSHTSLVYDSIVYVKEIDRYTNGESKIEIDYQETHCDSSGLNYEHAKNFVNKNFKSLMKTSDITWLESETTIKEQRKEKLSHLKEIMKK